MAWTAPTTFVANQVLTAAMLNTYLRDNFLELDVAKALTVGSIVGVAGVNSLVESVPAFMFVSNISSTANTTYVDLPDTVVSVSLTTTSRALIMTSYHSTPATTGNRGFASYAVSGATTSAANDNASVSYQGIDGTKRLSFGSFDLFSGLTPGVNVFTQKYRITGGTCSFSNRSIMVWSQ